MSDDLELLIDLKDAQKEITSLRERLEQAERERDLHRRRVVRVYDEGKEEGFSAGIEAGRQAYDKIAQVYYGRTVRDMQGHFERDINSLSPTDNTTTVAEDCRRWSHYPIIFPLTKDGMGPATVGEDAASITFEVWDEELTSHGSYECLDDAINEAIRLNALAEQKERE